MNCKIYTKLVLPVFVLVFCYMSTVHAQLMGDIFPSMADSGGEGDKKTSATNITANTMDINLAGDVINLHGNVVVDDKDTNISADEIIVYLTTVEEEKKAKRLVADGNVVIIKKSAEEDQSAGEGKATAGNADYDLETGIIVLTEDPVLFQGPSYIKGDKISLFRGSDRAKIEGNQTMGRTSKLLYNPNAVEKHEEEKKDVEYNHEDSDEKGG